MGGFFMGKRRKYSPELKLQAVKLYLENGMSSSAIAKELNVAYSSRIRNWVAKYNKYGEKAFEYRRGQPSNSIKRRPQKGFKSLKEENEYLRAKLDFYEAIINLDVKKK